MNFIEKKIISNVINDTTNKSNEKYETKNEETTIEE